MAIQSKYASPFRIFTGRLIGLVMRKFDIPEYFKSGLISEVKRFRSEQDKYKNDFSPTVLDYGKIRFYLARHFGFCFGVQNAIEIAYKSLEENPDERIFLISEMIHNPDVNNDLREHGIDFIQDSYGNQLIPWEEITSKDIVIIPAFGTTIETLKLLEGKGIEFKTYNTTCPFVERVWNRSAEIGTKGFTVIIHGKHNHEETRATFSHTTQNTPSLIVLNYNEAKFLSDFILGKKSVAGFFDYFKGKFSEGFNPQKDLEKIGVVNQTTMLAEETQKISDLLKQTLIEKYGTENINKHFADTRDTLCYATNDNQTATKHLLNTDADFAIVVGGYNSSNTSHLYELLSEKFTAYFIRNSKELISKNEIRHFDLVSREIKITQEYFPSKDVINIALTSGASCPDSEVEAVIGKIVSFFEIEKIQPKISIFDLL